MVLRHIQVQGTLPVFEVAYVEGVTTITRDLARNLDLKEHTKLKLFVYQALE